MIQGYNPMRYDCAKQGCFNVKRRPKIEVFAECFHGKIAMGDVDGIVEINGHGLLLEWKSSDVELPIGQRIMYARLTRQCRLSVLIVYGNAETMVIRQYAWFADGKLHGVIDATLDALKAAIKSWAEWAAQQQQYKVVCGG